MQHHEEIDRLYAETQRLARQFRTTSKMPEPNGTPESNVEWIAYSRALVEYNDQLAALWATIARIASAADDVPGWAAWAASGQRYRHAAQASVWREEARKRTRRREEDVASGVLAEVDRLGEPVQVNGKTVGYATQPNTLEQNRLDGWEGSAVDVR